MSSSQALLPNERQFLDHLVDAIKKPKMEKARSVVAEVCPLAAEGERNQLISMLMFWEECIHADQLRKLLVLQQTQIASQEVHDAFHVRYLNMEDTRQFKQIVILMDEYIQQYPRSVWPYLIRGEVKRLLNLYHFKNEVIQDLRQAEFNHIFFDINEEKNYDKLFHELGTKAYMTVCDYEQAHAHHQKALANLKDDLHAKEDCATAFTDRLHLMISHVASGSPKEYYRVFKLATRAISSPTGMVIVDKIERLFCNFDLTPYRHDLGKLNVSDQDIIDDCKGRTFISGDSLSSRTLEELAKHKFKSGYAKVIMAQILNPNVRQKWGCTLEEAHIKLEKAVKLENGNRLDVGVFVEIENKVVLLRPLSAKYKDAKKLKDASEKIISEYRTHIVNLTQDGELTNQMIKQVKKVYIDAVNLNDQLDEFFTKPIVVLKNIGDAKNKPQQSQSASSLPPKEEQKEQDSNTSGNKNGNTTACAAESPSPADTAVIMAILASDEKENRAKTMCSVGTSSQDEDKFIQVSYKKEKAPILKSVGVSVSTQTPKIFKPIKHDAASQTTIVHQHDMSTQTDADEKETALVTMRAQMAELIAENLYLKYRDAEYEKWRGQLMDEAGKLYELVTMPFILPRAEFILNQHTEIQKKLDELSPNPAAKMTITLK